jgi:hypothetical protein
MHESVDINGSTFQTLIPGDPITAPGGIFAQPSNIGHHTQDRFAVVPEVDVNIGYAVTKWARVSVGYSFLYASNVVQPGNQINPLGNTTRTGFAAASGIPPIGPVAPTFSFNESSFWAQGMNFGLEFRF